MTTPQQLNIVKNASTTFLFNVAETPDEMLEEMGVNPYGIAIVYAHYWLANQALDDNHIEEDIEALMGASTLDGLTEEAEGFFSHEDASLSRQDLVDLLLRRGFVEDAAFSAFIAS